MALVTSSPKKGTEKVNLNIIARHAKRKQAALNAKIEKLMAQKLSDMLSARLHNQEISRANRYSILGDELNLRREIEFGFDVNQRDLTSGRTVLHDAIAYGHFHIVRMLCHNHPVDLSIPTLLGRASPLHMAVELGYRQIASVLITFGADVNNQDEYGHTPLHMVRTLPLLKLLLKYKVDACIKSREGLSPLAHYLKHVPPNEQIKEIEELLAAKEDARIAELSRIRLAETRSLRDMYLSKLDLVASGESSVVSSVTGGGGEGGGRGGGHREHKDQRSHGSHRKIEV